jgi:uncharacterized membrane protein
MSDTDHDDDRTGASGADDVRGYLLRGALVVLGLVAVIALFQFYTSALAAIGEWIAPEYRALFRAAFNLVVLLAASIAIVLVVRELRTEAETKAEAGATDDAGTENA